MFIYISGPYSAPSNEIIEKNIMKARDAAIMIAKKGHYPFIPHTMMRGWEDVYKVSRESVTQICLKWLEKCDAIYILASSPGAELERHLAVRLNLQVYYNIDDIPEGSCKSSF